MDQWYHQNVLLESFPPMYSLHLFQILTQSDYQIWPPSWKADFCVYRKKNVWRHTSIWVPDPCSFRVLDCSTLAPNIFWQFTFQDSWKNTFQWIYHAQNLRKYQIYFDKCFINIFAKESSRSDWGSNPRPTAAPPSTNYQCSNPLSQIAILKKNGSLDSGIQAWYPRHVANSGELLYTQ
jgi:hypothetical protein